MENKIIYNIKVDTNKNLILDDNYNNVINKLINDKINNNIDFKVNINNQNGIVDDELNVVVNCCINELFKKDNIFINNHNYSKMIEKFILNSIDIIRKNKDRDFVFDEEYIIFEVFRGFHYFRINPKRSVITEAKYNDFIVLGPEPLKQSQFRTLNELLPAFYAFLYENNLFDDIALNDLSKYYIGLA